MLTYKTNSQLLSITDAEGKKTEYEYSVRGEKTKEIYPDHNPTASPGDTDYGIIEFAFDPAGRLESTTDQAGDTVTNNFDMAGRGRESIETVRLIHLMIAADNMATFYL